MKKIDSASSLLKRLEAGYSLPPLSVVALRLIELASDESCSAGDLADLIEKDLALAVRLLRLANSVFYQTRSPAGTLKQAVVRVGLDRLRIMALSLSLRDTFPMGRIGPLDYEKFWRTSLYRALLAKSLARHLKIWSQEEAFVAGLILEVGLSIFFDLLIKGKDEEANIELDPLEALLDWERERYGVDHRQIGEAALRYWKFPESILACQSLYGEKAMAEGAPELAKLCELGSLFSRILLEPSTDFRSLFTWKAASTIDLDLELINDVLLATFEEVQVIAGNLKLEVDKEKNLMEVMEKANRALSQISEKMAEFQDNSPYESPPSFESLKAEGRTVAETLQAVAHEIRNPLTAVGGFAKRLAVALDPVSAEGKYAQALLEEALRLENALSDMTRDR